MFWNSLLLLLTYRIVCTLAANESTTSAWNDIRNAFRAVTNDSELLDHIIPEMYGSTMRDANPTFVFKMPSQPDDGPAAFETLTMLRSDFEEPIFPNITQLTTVVGSSEQVAHVKTGLPEAPQGQWLQLGLGGWTGEIIRPVPWLEQSHKDSQPSNWQASYPREEILLDLKSSHFDGRVTDIRVITGQTNANEAELEDLMNAENVYIARVNDPFGYSMKWTRSNTTEELATVDRGKRDVAKLYSMIKCSTGCDPLIFKGYGCYCGFGGHGVPSDGIDRCCRMHDKCYEQSNCISYLEYFVPYVWKCYRGKPLCAVNHGQWGGPDSCAARLCQCDLRLSRCLRKFYCPRRRAICYSSRARRLQNLIFFD